MHGRNLTSLLALLFVAGPGVAEARAFEDPGTAPRPKPAAKSALVDVQSRPLPRIAPGTVVGDEPPRGWSHLIVQARPRLGVGDVDSVPRYATQYTSIFLFTALANVRQSPSNGDAPSYYLEKVAIGGAVDLDGKTVIATSNQTFGKDLGMIGRRVFQESENAINTEIRQVARTRTMLVFDGKVNYLYHQKHSLMILRHVIVVSPRDGRLTTFAWLLGSDGKGGYALAENTLQLLPPGLREDRVLSVDGDKFTLGIPAEDAFAMVKIPQGTPVKFSPNLAKLAAVRRFDADSAQRLEAELQSRYAPLSDRLSRAKTARR